MIDFALVFRDNINSKISGSWEQQTFLTTEQLKEKVPAIESYDLYAPIVKVANVEKIEIFGTTFTNDNNSFSLGIGNNVFYKDYVFKYDEETKILYVNKAAMVDSLFMENYYVKINDEYLFEGDLNDINAIQPKDDSVKFTCTDDEDKISKKEDSQNEYNVTIKNRTHLLSFDYDTGINGDMFIIRSQYIKGITKYKPTISFDNYSEKGFYLAGSSEFFNEPYTVIKELVVIGSDKSIKGKLTFIFNVTTTNT